MRKKILVVEDIELNLDLVKQLLEDTYELVFALDGEQGVALAERERPDLILMDMSLPRIDGWEATRRIRAVHGLEQIPIIGLSAHAMSADVGRAVAAGCTDYLSKPLDETELFEKLTHYLGK